MSSFSKFLKKHAAEMKLLANTLKEIGLGVALDKAGKEKLLATVDAFQAGADNIEKSIKRVTAEKETADTKVVPVNEPGTVE